MEENHRRVFQWKGKQITFREFTKQAKGSCKRKTKGSSETYLYAHLASTLSPDSSQLPPWKDQPTRLGQFGGHFDDFRGNDIGGTERDKITKKAINTQQQIQIVPNELSI